MLAVSFALYFISGISITAGYHRYFAHTTYKTKPVVETVLLFFASMATQASALRWAFEHRLHHAYVDTDRDPYSVKEGFWHAHILWLFKKPAPIDNKVVADLVKNPRVMFQHNHYLFCMLGSNILMFLLVGFLMDDFLGAFIFSWWTRLFFLHHSTWSINSLAHMWGSRSFCREQSAVDNYIISLITFGEGYHNYHHTFANDYRNGIRWYHFDPSKWLIWALAKCGLASNLKEMNPFHIRERMIAEQKKELLEAIQSSFSTKKEELSLYATKISDDLVSKLQQLRRYSEAYGEKKRAQAYEGMDQIRAEIRELNKSMRHDFKRSQDLAREVMSAS
jgi:stearoyl-CoA desaturase (delta-9 desaturase)